MAELDEHIVAPARLKLMTTLTAVSEAEFATVRAAYEGGQQSVDRVQSWIRLSLHV